MNRVINNEDITIEINPKRGAKLSSIRAYGVEWMWQSTKTPHSSIDHSPLSIGDSFDAHWEGGWEEMFPNDAACSVLGTYLPDHGELWSQKWDEVEITNQSATFRYACNKVAVNVQKTFRILDRTGTRTSVEYSFANQSQYEVPYLFKLHPAFQAQDGDEIIMPNCMIEPVSLDFSDIIQCEGKTPFPYGLRKSGDLVEINRISKHYSREFVYASELEQGWCGVRRTDGSQFLLRFNLEDFPYVWLFQSFGGWNGHTVAIVEPCNGMPYNLSKAIDQGTCGFLAPFEKKTVRIEFEIILPSP